MNDYTHSTRWKPVGEPVKQGFHKWTQGDVLEGKWLGPTLGPFGQVGQIEQQGGGVTKFSLSKVLADKLGKVAPGTLARIQFVGWVSSRNGRSYRDFSVMVADGSSEGSTGVSKVDES